MKYLSRTDEFARNAPALSEIIRSRPAGFTLEPDGSQPASGYVVAPSKDTERVSASLDSLTVGDLVRYINENRALLSLPGSKLGGWVSDAGDVVLDVSFVVPNLGDALRIGRAASQDAVFDLDACESIAIDDSIEPGIAADEAPFAACRAAARLV
jgi:hypothetical protein